MADCLAPERFRIGAGKPISWQGWLLTIGYVFHIVAAALSLLKSPLTFLAVLAPATVALF